MTPGTRPTLFYRARQAPPAWPELIRITAMVGALWGAFLGMCCCILGGDSGISDAAIPALNLLGFGAVSACIGAVVALFAGIMLWGIIRLVDWAVRFID